MSAVRAATCALALAAMSVAASADAKGLAWSTTFATAKAPKKLTMTAEFTDAKGNVQSLRVVRDGDARLRRDTGERLSLFVAPGEAGQAEEYVLLDRARNLRVVVNRSNLARIGVFTDYRGLSTQLTEPKGKYTLRASAKKALKTDVGTCTWFDIDQAGAVQSVCWSAPLGLPLAIETPDKASGAPRTTFRVTSVKTELPDGQPFDSRPAGFVEVDANADIHGDD